MKDLSKQPREGLFSFLKWPLPVFISLFLVEILWGCWNSSTLATSCEELTPWKTPWCWEGLGAGGEGNDRGWDGWMASPTRWTWVWVNSGSWWWTGRPGVLQFMESQRVRHDWVTELNWIHYVTDWDMEKSLKHYLEKSLLFKIFVN